jgi:ubiquitin-conjugating enzyme E2 I
VLIPHHTHTATAYGFYAKPVKGADGSLNLLEWEAGIPGREGTAWAGGVYRLKLSFPPDYPSKPPACQFTPPLFHPNLFSDGHVCLSIINESQDWKPSLTMKQVLLGIQELLGDPNPDSPAHDGAYRLYLKDVAAYERRIRDQARQFTPAA